MQNKRAIYPYLSPSRPFILAHRGFVASPDMVENTLPAFKAALDLGATHIESDIQVTSDGIPVLFHDDDLSRVAAIPQKIAELTSTELVALSESSGLSIPTLREALIAFPEARFNLDLKVWSAIQPAAAVISELGAENRVLVTSFSDRRRKGVSKLLNGNVASSAGSGRVLALWVFSALRFRPALALVARPVQALQVPTALGLMRLDSPRFIKNMKGVGLEIHYWTINDADEMARLIDLGADGIVTDRTDIAVNTLRTSR